MPTIVPLDHLDLRVDPAPWELAEQNRAAVDAHFAELLRGNPDMWNGRILLLASHRVEDRTLVGRYKETDFASLMWWRDNGHPDPDIRNAFAMGALRGADGGFILGRMAGWTANAGRIYFAAGTPDLSDITPDGGVDLEGSVLRELDEETGLSTSDVVVARSWTGVFDGPRIALMRPLVAVESTDEIAARIRAFTAVQERPEIAEVVIARDPGDLAEAMPDFIRAYLLYVWEGGEQGG